MHHCLTAMRYSGFSSLLWFSYEIKKRRRCWFTTNLRFRDTAGITSKGFSVCSLRSDQTPTAMRYSGFSSLDYCFSEIKKRRRCRFTTNLRFRDTAGIRTPNLLIRSQVLYPVKLQRHWIGENSIFI